MGLDVKRDWPILAAGALGVGAIVALKSGTSSGYITLMPDTAAQTATINAGFAAQSAHDSNLQQALASYLAYEAHLNDNATSISVANVEADLAALQGANAIANTQAQGAAAVAYANANKPSFWEQISGFIDSLANAFTAYSTHSTSSSTGGKA